MWEDSAVLHGCPTYSVVQPVLGLHWSTRPQLLVDVGTTAEIVLGDGQKVWAASSPTEIGESRRISRTADWPSGPTADTVISVPDA